eukprot:7757546-Ditylum_brightwellii.AAC.1
MLPKFEEGYNSDGEAGLWCDDLETEGWQDFEEEVVMEGVPTSHDNTIAPDEDVSPPLVPPYTVDAAADVPEEEEVGHVEILEAVLANMKVAQLKEELKLRAQPISGNKPVLLDHLKMALQNKFLLGGRR